MNIAVTGGITSNDVGSLMGIGGTPRENSFRWQAPLAPGEQPSKGHTLDGDCKYTLFVFMNTDV